MESLKAAWEAQDCSCYGPECLIKPAKPKLPSKGGKPATKSNQKNGQKGGYRSQSKSYGHSKNKKKK